MSVDNYNNLITGFCRSVGMVDPLINDDGYYSFLLDDNLSVEVQYDFDSKMVSFFLQLGPITSTNRDGVIKDMLDANVLWRGTGGGTLGLDSASGLVTLAYQESAESMPYSRFEAILGLLISNAEIWMNRIATESLVQNSFSEHSLAPGALQA
jgi:hypothetical protein